MYDRMIMHVLDAISVPIFSLIAYSSVGLFSVTIAIAARDGISYLKRMHQIPCPDCQFFTGDYQLKCALHPHTALSEEAIGCSDFCPQNHCSSKNSQAIAQSDSYRVGNFSN
ncbi:hypothetical protein IQ272_26880 [Chroococcidiopsidales cyanobacterium LEGE 13417]|uniref:hypothetical protein n=1 Tax=Chroococcidiopsis sp. CCALA 051 TaxID=869949 RepID=UPI0019F22244|nr:hypothetical protein [Chroococcidiopsis sp. CCALA 051]MBE9019691.1 hypothetical protein [Chroococcidiopsidales cyanobacterium LEGE 13417]